LTEELNRLAWINKMTEPITIWLSIGSTYSYLTALRINAIKQEKGLNLLVKPISIRAIMKSMDNIPFPPSKKTKVDYMWRDIERRAEWYGLPKPKLPAPYPLQAFDQANKVGIVLNQKGKYLEYFEETYRIWFVSGIEAGSEENLRLVFNSMQLNYEDIMHQAGDGIIQKIYEENTEEAKQLGVFGAPSFSVGNEIFWGDDRLEDAIRFSANQIREMGLSK
jgi:2-hydroxychromene-2-carboxylate isomerase